MDISDIQKGAWSQVIDLPFTFIVDTFFLPLDLKANWQRAIHTEHIQTRHPSQQYRCRRQSPVTCPSLALASCKHREEPLERGSPSCICSPDL